MEQTITDYLWTIPPQSRLPLLQSIQTLLLTDQFGQLPYELQTMILAKAYPTFDVMVNSNYYGYTRQYKMRLSTESTPEYLTRYHNNQSNSCPVRYIPLDNDEPPENFLEFLSSGETELNTEDLGFECMGPLGPTGPNGPVVCDSCVDLAKQECPDADYCMCSVDIPCTYDGCMYYVDHHRDEPCGLDLGDWKNLERKCTTPVKAQCMYGWSSGCNSDYVPCRWCGLVYDHFTDSKILPPDPT